MNPWASRIPYYYGWQIVTTSNTTNDPWLTPLGATFARTLTEIRALPQTSADKDDDGREQ